MTELKIGQRALFGHCKHCGKVMAVLPLPPSGQIAFEPGVRFRSPCPHCNAESVFVPGELQLGTVMPKH